MVELCGIEPQSENGQQKASTCLETLFKFQATFTQRAKLDRPSLKVRLRPRHSENIAIAGVILQFHSVIA